MKLWKKITGYTLAAVMQLSIISIPASAEDLNGYELLLEEQTEDQIIEKNGVRTLFGEVILEDSESGPIIEEDGIMMLSEYTGNRDWKWPVPDSNTLSSCYLDGRSHYAIDIVAPKGTAIYASYPGTVIATSRACSHNYAKRGSCGCNGGMGNYVFIRHNYNGVDFVTRSIHLTSVKVSTGDYVTKDTVIGTVGSTGSSRGFHLDFRIYQGSEKTSSKTTCVDPLKDQFLEIPEGLNANAASTTCCYTYVKEVKSIYAIPLLPEDTQPPVISDVQITADADGYTVTCQVTDNSEIDRVQFPTWTSIGGQDDLDRTWSTSKFSRGTIKNGKVTYRVNVSDHNNEYGLYITDIYAYDICGNYSAYRVQCIVEENVLPFQDVSTTNWYYDAVVHAYQNGIMSGITSSSFAPLETITRSQFAVMLYRLEGSPKVTRENDFSDVLEGQWYTDAIIWASNKGVVNGYTESNLFGTKDEISREQIAVMLYRYAVYKEYDISQTASAERFTDADEISGYAKDAVEWTLGSGFISGKDEEILDPLGNAKRAECAAVFERFMEKYF